MISKVLEFLNGKKTYITATLIGVAACLNALGVVIPEWVWAFLGAIGLGAVRASIK